METAETTAAMRPGTFAAGWSAAFGRSMPADTDWLLRHAELHGLVSERGHPVAGFAARPVALAADGTIRPGALLSDLWVVPGHTGRGHLGRALRAYLEGLRPDAVAAVFVNRKRTAGRTLSRVGFVAQPRIGCVAAPVAALASPAPPPGLHVVHQDRTGAFGLGTVARLCRIPRSDALSMVRTPGYLGWRFDRMPREYRCAGAVDTGGVLRGFVLAKPHPPKGRLHVLLAGGEPAVVAALVRALAERVDPGWEVDIRPRIAAWAGPELGAGFGEEPTIWTPYVWNGGGRRLEVDGDEVSTV